MKRVGKYLDVFITLLIQLCILEDIVFCFREFKFIDLYGFYLRFI